MTDKNFIGRKWLKMAERLPKNAVIGHDDANPACRGLAGRDAKVEPAQRLSSQRFSYETGFSYETTSVLSGND